MFKTLSLSLSLSLSLPVPPLPFPPLLIRLTNGRVAKVEPVNSKEAKEQRQGHSYVIVILLTSAGRNSYNYVRL